MGTRTRGLAELIADLETLEERAEDKFPKLLGRGALNIKTEWRAAWKAASPHGHIPHLIRAIGYDVEQHGSTFEAAVGPKAGTLQSGLAEYITYGTLTSAPHDAGQAALDAEDPRFVRAVAEAAEELLDGRG